MDVWVEREVDGCEFPDQRLKARLGKLLGDLGRRIGGTVPAACQDWAATKAAYRFFGNPRVDEGIILYQFFSDNRDAFISLARTRVELVIPDQPRRMAPTSWELRPLGPEAVPGRRPGKERDQVDHLQERRPDETFGWSRAAERTDATSAPPAALDGP
ncbi:MAG TPA: transposase [Gemmataceae bacterium]|nr:transposase [Gemmataceae bacterium]